MGLFDDLFFSGGEINNYHYGPEDYERYKRAKARSENAVARREDVEYKRRMREEKRVEKLEYEERKRLENAIQKDIDAKRREDLAKTTETAKTERERLRQEGMILREKLALERQEREIEEKQNRIKAARDLEELAKELTKEHMNKISNFSHPADKDNLKIQSDFDLDKVINILSGEAPFFYKSPENKVVLVDYQRFFNYTLPIKATPMPKKDHEFTQSVLNHYGPGNFDKSGRRHGGWWKPEFCINDVKKTLFMKDDTILQKAAEIAQNKNKGLEKTIDKEYDRTLLDWYQKTSKIESELNADNVLKELSLLKTSLSRTRDAISSIKKENEDNTRLHLQKIEEYKDLKELYLKRKKEIQEDYSRYIHDYINGDSIGVVSYIEAVAVYGLRDHANDGIRLVADWDKETGKAIIDFVLPKLNPPRILRCEVNHQAENINEIPIEKNDIKEMIETAQQELIIRVALETIIRDYKNKISELTVNCWYQGIDYQGVMKNIVCQSSIIITKDVAEGYQGGVQGLLRAIPNKISVDEENPVEPFDTLVVDGVLEYGDTMDRVEPLIRGFIAMEKKVDFMTMIVEEDFSLKEKMIFLPEDVFQNQYSSYEYDSTPKSLGLLEPLEIPDFLKKYK